MTSLAPIVPFLADVPQWQARIAIGLLLLIHICVLSTRRHAWLGLMFPVVWTALCIGRAVTGQFTEGVDWLLSAGVLVGLLLFTGWGRSWRRAKIAREDARIDALNRPAA